MSLARFLVLVSFFATGLFAQLFSYGIEGGGAVINAFADQTQGSGVNTIHTFSGSKDYIIGPTVEIHLPFHLSVEADALFRPYFLKSNESTQIVTVNQTGGTELANTYTLQSSTAIHAWEFPILAKYRLSGQPLIKPYGAAGPSFRASGSGLSSKGFTIGAGVDIKALFLHVSPEVRYTYWGQGNPVDAATTPAYSNHNQVELLVGITF